MTRYSIYCISINPSAVCPNLSFSTSQNPNIPHLDHRRLKGVEEIILIGTEGIYDVDSVGSGGREKHLVASEKPVLLLEVWKVLVVEDVGCG